MAPSGIEAVAAIDCGTNTIKLLIAYRDEDGAMVDLERESRTVRLGQDIDRTGEFAPEALERTFAAIDEYAALIRQHGVVRARFVATSASRDAKNGATFLAGVRERLGVTPDVVRGDVEAALAFDGAVRGLRGVVATPLLVVDIGGGSTELTRGSSIAPGSTPDEAFSMNIGSVRLHERHLHSDPPTPEEIAAASRDIEAALDASPVKATGAATVIGVAGTVTQYAAGVLGLTKYDRAAIDQARLRVEDIEDIVERWLAMTVAERLAVPAMHPGRADVIGAGGLILRAVLRRAGVSELLVSESDILDGIAWSIAATPTASLARD